MSSLHLSGVSVTFTAEGRCTRALEDIDLNVRSGEFLCVVGPSGCGKSTLLNVIAGLQKATQGTIRRDETPIDAPGPDRVVMFQEPALFPWLSAVKNVEFPLKQRIRDRKARREKAMEYMRLVQLEQFAGSRVHELSGGMKQRIALARCLAADPQVLLMDEPFAALDAQTRDMLHAELQEIWQRTHKTIVFVTHNVREAVCLGDRVVLMTPRPGRIAQHFDIGLPRPRSLEDHALVEQARVVMQALRRETSNDTADATPRFDELSMTAPVSGGSGRS